MPSIHWKLPFDCSDASLATRDQILSMVDETAISLSLTDYGSKEDDRSAKWDNHDTLLETLKNIIIDANAPTIHCGDPSVFELNPNTANVTFWTGGVPGAANIDILSRMDEIWVTPGKASSVLLDALIPHNKIKLVMPVLYYKTHGVAVPKGEKTIFCHTDWSERVGLEAFLRGWMREDAFGNSLLLLSVRHATKSQMEVFVASLRNEEKRSGGSSHKISLLAKKDPSLLDACILASDVVVSPHLSNVGWLHTIAKAAGEQKAIVATTKGDLPQYLWSCNWVSVTDPATAIPEMRNEAMEALIVAFQQSLLQALIAPNIPELYKIKGANLLQICKDRATILMKKGD